MRCVAMFACLLSCCGGLPEAPINELFAVPVEVVGDGEQGVVVGNDVLVGDVAACRRAIDDEQWVELGTAIGGDFATFATDYLEMEFEQRVVVPLPGPMQLRGIVVSSEEGVDVITLDVHGGRVHETTAAKRGCLLRLARRECQIAVILRDQDRGEERTVAVFAGL